MDLELVTVGTELLLGFTVDTNAAELGLALAEVGARVVRRTTVPDQQQAIETAVADALVRTGFVIITGGLGPTRDDVTKRAVAGIFGSPLVLDREYLETLRARFEKLGRGPMPEANRSQAEIPRGAVVLPNRRGTAPGLWLAGEPGIAVLLPGIPREMRGLLEREVLPRIVGRLRGAGGGAPPVTRSRTLRTTGVPESHLAELLESAEGALDRVSLAYLPSTDGVDLRLTAWQLPPDDADRVLERAAASLANALGRNLYGEGDVMLAEVVLDALRRRNLRLAVAESCTGGMLGARLTSVAGASEVFAGAVVCYENASKIRDLGLPPEMIEGAGAVSDPVARAMARGVQRRFAVETAVAITGVAGPGGGTEEKPVGTVWLAVCVGNRETSRKIWVPGGRAVVRERATQAGLDLLRRTLLEEYPDV